MEHYFKIKETADFYNITPRTLRYYEELNLITPKIDETSKYRLYGKVQIEELESIVQLKSMGLSLDEIKNILKNRFGNSKSIKDCKEEILNLQLKLKELEFMSTKRGKYSVDIFEIPNRLTLVKKIQSYSHANLIDEFHKFIAEMITRKVKLANFKRYFIELCEGNFADGIATVKIHANISTDNKSLKGAGIFYGGKFIRTCHRGTWNEIPNAFDFLYSYAKENNIPIKKLPFVTYVNGTFSMKAQTI